MVLGGKAAAYMYGRIDIHFKKHICTQLLPTVVLYKNNKVTGIATPSQGDNYERPTTCWQQRNVIVQQVIEKD